MSVPRIGIVLLALAGIGLAVVQFRSQRTQYVHGMQQIRSEQLQLQRRIWTLQMEKARLGAPARIRERIREVDSTVVPPHEVADSSRESQAGRNTP